MASPYPQAMGDFTTAGLETVLGALTRESRSRGRSRAVEEFPVTAFGRMPSCEGEISKGFFASIELVINSELRVMGVLIVADLPSVRVRATNEVGQAWLDKRIDPLVEDWNRGWLVMPANRAAFFASQAVFDRIPITYELK